MWHTVFITIHALAGTVAFAAGCVALRRGALFGTYLASMAAMLGFLVLAIATEWSILPAPTRIVFGALTALAVVMLSRAELARRCRPHAARDPRYFNHVGFTLVGLLDAFVVVAVLNAGAPGWLVVAVALGIAAAGHLVLRDVQRRTAVPVGA